MTIQELKKEIRAKNLELRDLRKSSQSTNDVTELRSINTKLDALIEARDQLEDKLFDAENSGQSNSDFSGDGQSARTRAINGAEQRSAGSTVGATQIMGTYFTPGTGFRSVDGASFDNKTQKRGNDNMKNLSAEDKQRYEERGNDLKRGMPVTFGVDEIEMRSVTVSSGSLVLPQHTSNTLNTAPTGVSGLVDVVNSPPLLGGESYSKGFVVGYGTGDYTGEGEDYQDAEPTFDYVTTGKQKITAYAEISNEVSRLPNADYQGEVANAVRIAVRRKIGQQIILGTGTASITGLYNTPAKCSFQTLEVQAIGSDTLADLIFGHGDNEEVDGGNTLILNKTDLHAFAKVKDATGKNVYKIELDATGNTGRIGAGDSYMIPFVINSSCNALSAVGTTVGAKTMIFGKLLGYELPIFSDLTVERSTDYKFKQGMVCYRAEIYVGGTPASYKNFTIVSKIA